MSDEGWPDEVARSAAGFDRIRRAHQTEIAEDYVEMISDLIAARGEARAVDLAERFGVTQATVNQTVARLQRDGLVTTPPLRSIFPTRGGGIGRRPRWTSVHKSEPVIRIYPENK